jgi:hypothetical protein
MNLSPARGNGPLTVGVLLAALSGVGPSAQDDAAVRYPHTGCRSGSDRDGGSQLVPEKLSFTLQSPELLPALEFM